MARSSDAAFPLSLIRDQTFQMRQLRRVLALVAFFVLQSTLLLGAFHHGLLGRIVSGNAPLLFASEDIASMAAAVPSVADTMGRWLLIMLGMNAVVTGIIGVWIVRKLGNPILAIRRALNEIGDGNLEVRLRAGDEGEFAELCTALNRALETVHGKIAEARDATAVLDRPAERPESDARAVREGLERCRETLAWFDGGARRGRDPTPTAGPARAAGS